MKKLLNKKYFGFLNIFIYIFLTEILTYFFTKIIFFKNPLLINLYCLIPSSLVLILLIYINKDIFTNKFQDLKKNFQKYFNLTIRYYLCGLLSMIIASNILSLFTSPISQNEALNREALQKLPIYSALAMVIIAPLTEEITFRGSFKKGYPNKKVFLLLTSFLFGFMHVIFNGDFLNFLPYSALGYFLGKIYYETDNILLSILTHSFHNFLCILILFLGSAI